MTEVADPRAVIVAVYHRDDEPQWRKLAATLLEEGALVLARFREVLIGDDGDTVITGPADMILPLVSCRFVGADGPGIVRTVMASASEHELIPIRLDDVDLAASGLGEWQMAPQAKPVLRWPIETMAYRNVAHHVVDRLIGIVGFRPGGDEVVDRLVTVDFDRDGPKRWARPVMIAGGIASILWWAFSRQWAVAHWYFIALSIAPAIATLVLHSRELIDPLYEDAAFMKVARAAIRLLPSWVAAPFAFLAMHRLSEMLTGRSGGRSIITAAEVGLGGSLLVALLAYLSTRRRRPRYQLSLRPPAPEDPYIHIDRGRVVMEVSRSGFGGYVYVIRVPSWRIFFLGIELAVFTAAAWTVYRFFYNIDWFIRNVGALWWMGLVESVLLTTWIDFGHLPRALRSMNRGPALRQWFRKWWMQVKGTHTPWPFLVPAALLDVVTFFERDNTAPPVLTAIAFAIWRVKIQRKFGRVEAREDRGTKPLPPAPGFENPAVNR